MESEDRDAGLAKVITLQDISRVERMERQMREAEKLAAIDINVIFMFLWGVHIGTGIFLLDKGFVFIFIGLVLVLFYLMVSEILLSGIASNDPLKYAFSLARVIKLYMIQTNNRNKRHNYDI